MKTFNYRLLSIETTRVFFNKISLKKMLSFLYLMIFLNLFISCDMNDNLDDNINTISSIISMDSLMNLSRDKCEILEVKLSNDTLLIVSTEEILYYPFGQYRSFKDFQSSQPIQDNSYSIDSIETEFKVITLKSVNNFLKLLASKESGNLEIINAEIKDNNLMFSNGVKIGISQKEFLSIFFYSVPDELEKVSVIELESGLTGIRHYYSFSKNKLKRISLISDYQIDN